MSNPILVTGAAGFIGSHVTLALLKQGHHVVGIDNLNAYYDPSLKQARLARLSSPQFRFYRVDVADRDAMEALFSGVQPTKVVHLAAEVGVRHSFVDRKPHAYADTNITGFLNVLEGCRTSDIEHLVYASTSSVYGLDECLPFSEHQGGDHPVSLYGATKRANELMAHCYSHQFQIPTTGLRFFTVYGPWGRPDMAPMLFTKAILEGQPIRVFNAGQMLRDFTYVDDVVEGIVRTLGKPAAPNPDWSGDPATSKAPYRVYNIGNGEAVQLMHFISLIENALGKKAILDMQPMQASDVLSTKADTDDLARDFGFRPATRIEDGVAAFVAWYRRYYWDEAVAA